MKKTFLIACIALSACSTTPIQSRFDYARPRIEQATQQCALNLKNEIPNDNERQDLCKSRYAISGEYAKSCGYYYLSKKIAEHPNFTIRVTNFLDWIMVSCALRETPITATPTTIPYHLLTPAEKQKYPPIDINTHFPGVITGITVRYLP